MLQLCLCCSYVYVAAMSMLQLCLCCSYVYVTAMSMLQLCLCCSYVYVAAMSMLQLCLCCSYVYVATASSLRFRAKQNKQEQKKNTEYISVPLPLLLLQMLLPPIMEMSVLTS